MDQIRYNLELLNRRTDPTPPIKLLWQNCPLLPAAIALILGILTHYNFRLPPIIYLLLLIIPFTILTLAKKIKKYITAANLVTLAIIISFFSMGSLKVASHLNCPPNHIKNFVKNQQRLATIKATVISKPKISNEKNWKFAKYTWSPQNASFYAQLKKIKTTEGFKDISGKILFNVPQNHKQLNVGDYILAYTWLSPINGPKNPGQFNFKKYMENKNIHTSAFVKSPEGIEIIKKAKPSLLTSLKNKISSVAYTALIDQSLLYPQNKQLINALLLGNRTNLDPIAYEAFRKTGLAHFISLSGLHVGIIITFVWIILRTAGIIKPLRALICIIFVLIYVSILPTRAPTLRAAVIAVFILTGQIFGKKPHPLNALSLSAIFILLIRPEDIFSPGWQLSYSTVLAIILLYPAITEPLSVKLKILLSKLPSTRTLKLIKTVIITSLEIFLVGLCAWLGGLGILLYHFKTVTILSPLWTLITFPIVFLLLLFSFTQLTIGLLLPTSAMIISLLNDKLAQLLTNIVKFLALHDPSYIILGAIPISIAAIYYLTLLHYRITLYRKTKVNKLITAILTLTFIFSISALKLSRTKRSHLEMTVMHTGKGQSILVQLPPDINILFDAGSMSYRDPGNRIIAPALIHKAVTSLDALFISHDDIDHLNGSYELLTKIPAKAVYVNDTFLQAAKEKSSASYLAQSLKEIKIPLKNDKDFNLPPSPAKLLILSNQLPKFRSDNNNSQVILISFAEKNILITADIQNIAQQHLLQILQNKKIDILITPHHGSKNKSIPDLHRKLKADYAITNCSLSQYKKSVNIITDIKSFYTCIDSAVKVKIKADGSISAVSHKISQ